MFKNMKSSLLFSFFLLAISHFLFASASPTPAEASAAGTTTSGAETPEDRVIDYIHSNPGKLNPPCFYSGSTKLDNGTTVNAYQVVQTEWIDKGLVPKDCVVIGAVVKDAGVKEDEIKDWAKVSQAFAQSVAGKVYVLLGKVIRADSVWLKYESPALQKNEKVTGVGRWEIETNGKIVPVFKA